MVASENSPSIRENAFDCPHCGAYTTQQWFDLYAKEIDEKQKLPFVPNSATRMQIESDPKLEPDERRELLGFVDAVLHGLVAGVEQKETEYLRFQLFSLFLSKCFRCEKYSVWLCDRLIFPTSVEGPQPVRDMPEDVCADFNEARSTVNSSPRGAAALLRLAIQKLCIHLGGKGENLSEDIGSLVARGLNPTVQKSLDIVRVIGNEAVHPGTLDLKDDRDTAVLLLSLVNLIVEQMITNPKKVEEMYAKLPKDKRKAIEKRDR